MAMQIKVPAAEESKTAYFRSFEGVDFTTPYNELSSLTSPFAVNMYRDRTAGGALRTRPRMRRIAATSLKGFPLVINEKVFFRAGTRLFPLPDTDLKDEYNINFLRKGYITKPGEERSPFLQEEPSRGMNVIYDGQLYMYEKNLEGQADVFILREGEGETDPCYIESFSDRLNNLSTLAEGQVFLFMTKKNSTNRYTTADYDSRDVLRLLRIVAGRISPDEVTEEDKRKYTIRIGVKGEEPTKPDDTLTVVNVINVQRIVIGRAPRYTETSYTAEDYALACENVGETSDNHPNMTDEEFAKCDTNADGIITDTDRLVIERALNRNSIRLDSLPVELAPITFINCGSQGGGEPYERLNLLSPFFINRFIAEKDVTSYALSHEGATALMLQTGAGEPQTLSNQTAGSVKIPEALQEGTVFYILAKIPPEEYRANNEIISSMTIARFFDNRVFMGGSDRLTDRIIHSAAANPFYFPENSYYEDVMGSGRITALLACGRSLAVIKEDGKEPGAVYIHTPTDTELDTAPRIYPSEYGMFEFGCVNRDCFTVFNDEAVFLSSKGLKLISSSDISQERSIKHMSSAIDGKLLAHDLSGACMGVWREYLLICVEGDVFLADGANSSGGEYRWFYWQGCDTLNEAAAAIGPNITIPVAVGRDLYMFTRCRHNDIYKNHLSVAYKMTYERDKDGCFRDVSQTNYRQTEVEQVMSREVFSCAATPLFSFGYPNRWKSSGRNGGVARLDCEGDGKEGVRVSVKTSLEPFSVEAVKAASVTGVKISGDRVIYRLKNKKWIELSLIFWSRAPITFYEASLQAYIKNFAKR